MHAGHFDPALVRSGDFRFLTRAMRAETPAGQCRMVRAAAVSLCVLTHFYFFIYKVWRLLYNEHIAGLSQKRGRKNMVELAVAADLNGILQVQKLAFAPVAQEEGNLHIPPLTQTQTDIGAEYTLRTFFKYTQDGRIVGSVRAHLEDNGVCQIGRLAVLPEHQGRGIGKALMTAAEDYYAHCVRYELFTGEHHPDTVAFYSNLGYTVTKKMVMDGVHMLLMTKSGAGFAPKRKSAAKKPGSTQR